MVMLQTHRFFLLIHGTTSTVWSPALAGGCKEAFHSVYQAFEALADPEARRRYDETSEGQTSDTSSGWRKKGKTKKRHDGQKPQKPPAGPKKGIHSPKKLLSKLYDLLKGLSRELRNEVISKDFSQKQRVLLEAWIVQQREAEAPVTPVPAEPKPGAEPADSSSSLALNLRHTPSSPTATFQPKKKKNKNGVLKGILVLLFG